MARTPSMMLPLGTKMPTFMLTDTEDKVFNSSQQALGRPWLVMFICNHCPFVKHVAEELARLGREYQQRGVHVVAINSNDTLAYPADNLANMKLEKTNRAYSFPYLLDEKQAVAKAFQAACTPDFYVFDQNQKLVYRGQLDGSRPGNDIPVDGRDIRAALDAVLAKKSVNTAQVPSIGCNIKWQKGNEPDYYK